MKKKDYSFSDEYVEFQSRHFVLKEIGLKGMKKIKEGKVLLVGVGGLGSAAALYLVHSGIGKLGIVDYDTVERSNLGRQIAYNLNDLNEKKVIALYKKLEKKNPECYIMAYSHKASSENFLDLVSDYDLVIEAVDDSSNKLLIHDLAIKANKPLVHAGVIRFIGQLLVVIPQETACLHCFFGKMDEFPSTGNCARDGVFSPLVGIMGSWQAAEALKFLTWGKKKLQVNSLLQLNLLELKFKKINLTYEGCAFCSFPNRK